jgi:hypothetical protein
MTEYNDPAVTVLALVRKSRVDAWATSLHIELIGSLSLFTPPWDDDTRRPYAWISLFSWFTNATKGWWERVLSKIMQLYSFELLGTLID